MSWLRIRPELSLDYPHSNITEIRKRGQDQGYEIETTFFGLYGVSSPLPGFYTDELFDDEWEEAQAGREFLDIIHYRLYPLLYRAWLKYRFYFNAVEKNDRSYWEILFSLIGLNEEFRGKFPNPGLLLKYTGIISQHPKSQLGLQTILSDVLNQIPIAIEPCVSRQVKINPRQQCLIGESNNQLGENSVVGEIVADSAGKFTIKLGPVEQPQFERIINDQTLLSKIHDLTGFFLLQPLLYDIELTLMKGAEKPIELGEVESSTLGKNTWLGHSDDERAYSLMLQ